MSSRKVSFLLMILTMIIYLSCSSSDEPVVDEILLTVDKDVALSMGDSVKIMTEVHSPVDERLQNIPLKYFANNTELDGPIFYPTQPGTYRISASYLDIESTKKDVRVISLEDNITSLELIYAGHTLLTTESWSVSGTFAFDVELDNQNFEVTTNDIDLLVNDVQVEKRGGLHFGVAGDYRVEAAFGELRSEPVMLTVREKLNLELVTIPVVFHDYGENISVGDLIPLIDTLNSVFNPDQYAIEDVLAGVVNPNAVDLKMRFELATEAPPGFSLSSKGIHKITPPSGPLNTTELTLDNTWDPDKYVNIWMVDAETYLNLDDFADYIWIGGGWTSRPQLLNEILPGLVTQEEDVLQHGPGLAIGGLSVFGEHPDYIVTTMGAYFGLYRTIDRACADHGDYINDTKTIDLSMTGLPTLPTGFFYDCDKELMRPTNFMSFDRQYRDFTYDQAQRIRTVMEHGLARPSGQ